MRQISIVGDVKFSKDVPCRCQDGNVVADRVSMRLVLDNAVQLSLGKELCRQPEVPVNALQHPALILNEVFEADDLDREWLYGFGSADPRQQKVGIKTLPDEAREACAAQFR